MANVKKQTDWFIVYCSLFGMYWFQPTETFFFFLAPASYFSFCCGCCCFPQTHVHLLVNSITMYVVYIVQPLCVRVKFFLLVLVAIIREIRHGKIHEITGKNKSSKLKFWSQWNCTCNLKEGKINRLHTFKFIHI